MNKQIFKRSWQSYEFNLKKQYEKEEELNRFVYNKLTVDNPKGDKFAAFYAYVKLCRIYNSKGELLKNSDSIEKNKS